MDNPEKLATYGTQDEGGKTHKKPTQCALATTLRKQIQIT